MGRLAIRAEVVGRGEARQWEDAGINRIPRIAQLRDPEPLYLLEYAVGF